ncbi:MAG TPA: cytochrome c oxidase assembly protein [Terriglobales bacterium]|nr:cytochrome c oxidase assembly protein [Terriglobales bacterium]
MPLTRERRRALAAGGAAGTLVLALAPPLGELSHHLLWAHMVQHELLMVVAAPLLVLARPVVLLARIAPARWGAAMLRAGAAIPAAPFAAWILHGVAVWAWHMPSLWAAAHASPLAHAAQHASFTLTAVFFWWSVLGRRAHYGASAAYLFATALHTGALGVLLTLAPRPWYAADAAMAAAWGLTPLQDQQLAGLIMWIAGGVGLAVSGLALVAAWLRHAGRRAARSLATGLAALLILPLLAGCDGARATASSYTGGDPARGREAIRRYGCQTCHTIPGVAGARAVVGPPLTQLARRGYVAGQSNTPELLMRWIRHPQQIRPATPMPDVGVTAEDSRHIAAYLYTLR